jgi:alpha-1,6-mannosyltransferase
MDDNVSAFISSSALGSRWANWYMQRVYAPRFDGHISNSEYTAGELSNALGPSHRLPVFVCPMGVHSESFDPSRRREAARGELCASLPKQAPVTGATRLLLYVGRISREKNLSLLVDMMEHLADDSGADYRLLIAGSGPRSAWLADLVERRIPGRAHLLGQVTDREQLANIYANCDALIHPNPREPFGIAPLEAMASGLPVVAPCFGGVLSYANCENAWLAEPSGGSFAAAVREIFAHPSVRQSKIEHDLHAAREFSWTRVTERFFELYDTLYARLSDAPALRPHTVSGTELII